MQGWTHVEKSTQPSIRRSTARIQWKKEVPRENHLSLREMEFQLTTSRTKTPTAKFKFTSYI
jgi:hypothetical protein